ncbi:bifunctional 2',3'-cyclic-nucleotide 2'-phosphodiesterase/3'-nucleotidase [Pseudotabrizicola alkalilacus]|uniref:bifunctional 2',3'-cyclic-nucleotide 2'-phosphodiesterase/3'-nucleotidase n=1 Tax=Pseudotabrizicola alkalilacus TaxID=2305252 RepID=UPI001314A9A7|nr:bifunctional 2',3'-cyclic-nucleotide 2'-phosphodiesterase/3'-nucleotidase [Pseudotabrizicola alkalilacus]
MPVAEHLSDPDGPALTERVQLRVLATSDLHMNLSGHDYHADTPCVRKGLCLTASLIAQARREVAGAVLLDNGDFLQGSPLGDYVARTALHPHPMMQAMGQLRYDAVNLGNHEFSHGIGTLAAALAEAAFPILSANTIPREDSPLAPLIRPWTIVERRLSDQYGTAHLIRLGVIGVLPPETEIWDRQAIGGHVKMCPMAETVARHIPELRAAGADVAVVLAHCGISATPPGGPPQDGALDIAAIDGVDAIVMGHVHMVFPGPGLTAQPGMDTQSATLHGKPAVMPGFFGSHLGVIDLELARSPDGWRVTGHRVEARAIACRDEAGSPVALVVPDASLTEQVRQVHQATRAWARKPVGRTAQAIHSFFAMVTDCPSVQIVNQAQSAYVAARLAGGPLAHLPVLSATAPFKAGGLGGPEHYTYIPPGDILLRHAADLYIHPNTIMALRLTGAAVRNWLERSVRGYRQITPGLADQPLFDPDLPSFVYDTIGGLSYEIDLTAAPSDRGGHRIRNPCWQNRPIDPAQEFILATNSYRGSGNDGYAPVESASVVLDEQTPNRDILIAYMQRLLSESGAALRPEPPAWRFQPVPGTSVAFDTSPMAAFCLGEHPALALTPLSGTNEGFLRLRLAL